MISQKSDEISPSKAIIRITLGDGTLLWNIPNTWPVLKKFNVSHLRLTNKGIDHCQGISQFMPNVEFEVYMDENKQEIIREYASHVIIMKSCECDYSKFKKLKGLEIFNCSEKSLNKFLCLQNLENLCISHTLINNFDALLEFTNLKSLDVSYTSFKDLNLLRNIKHLEKLCLLQTNVESFDELIHHSTLTDLSVGSLSNLNLKPLSFLPMLRRFECWIWSGFLDINPLESLVHLQDVKLSGEDIVGIHSLTKLRKLKSLTLNAVSINRSVEIFNHLADLEELDLTNSDISNCDWLVNFPNLKKLWLTNTPVTDCSPVLKLEKLENLYVEGSEIDDFSVLRGMSNLKFLYISIFEGNCAGKV